ncbi:YncE family protein [Malonomonas rubra]|uniref:YncE family protein n=1 Tax=Malonomonas rubra TaxID=57040 RepID=UPI001114D948|nr:hypothetical protein [Malonomonas rubra]
MSAPDARAPLSFSDQQALLTVYLKSRGVVEEIAPLQFVGLSVQVDDIWIDLDLPPASVDFQQQKGRQLLLGASVAPLGQHRSLRLLVRGLGEEGELRNFHLTLPETLDLNRGDSKCLFIEWEMLREGQGNGMVVPAFKAWGQRPVLGGNLLYVACGELNTVYVTRIDNSEVVAAFGIPGPLAEICLDDVRQRLYVLSKGRRSIYVYDCANERLLDQILLSSSVSPEYMILSAGGRYAYVSDPTAGSVYKVNLSEGRMTVQRRLGHRPGYLLEIDELNLLAVSSASSSQVFILNSDTLELNQAIQVGAKPHGLLYFAQSLYVAESASQSVSVYSPQSGRQIARISVDMGPLFLLSVDEETAYVSNSIGQSLSVLTAGQNVAFRRIGSVSSPAEMIHSSRKRLLYVVAKNSAYLTVIDQGTEKIVRSINYGGQPKSLALLETKF